MSLTKFSFLNLRVSPTFSQIAQKASSLYSIPMMRDSLQKLARQLMIKSLLVGGGGGGGGRERERENKIKTHSVTQIWIFVVR